MDMPDLPAGFEPLEPLYAHSFIGHIGPLYVSRGDNAPCVATRALPHQCNPFGELHGGFIAAFADFACAWSLLHGAERMPSGVTVQLSTQMIAGARLGEWIEARPTVRRRGRTIAHVGCEFTVGERLIAHADAVFRMLSEQGASERFNRRGSTAREIPSPLAGAGTPNTVPSPLAGEGIPAVPSPLAGEGQGEGAPAKPA